MRRESLAVRPDMPAHGRQSVLLLKQEHRESITQFPFEELGNYLSFESEMQASCSAAYPGIFHISFCYGNRAKHLTL